MGSRITKKYVAVVIVLLTIFGIVYRHNSKNCNAPLTEYIGPQRFVVDDGVNGNQQKYSYDRFLPLIFIGGMPRSGTTLLRATLDAHPDIRCGEETRVIPRVLGFRQQWMKAPFESRRLKEAGITSDVLDSAVTSFILEIIVKHGPPAPRLCNKDPFTLRSAVYLKQLFPNAKFVFMIRDGRAVVHSIISRKVTISGFDLKDPRQCLKKWNSAMHAMNFQCEQLGPSVCLPLHYEKLVLNPKFWLKKLLSFLNVPWNDTVLNHQNYINKPGGISLSNLERSTDQVIKPINLEALSKWVGQFPEDVVKDMPQIAPMLSVLGYDPSANPPNYGEPDSFVLRNMEQIKRNKEAWDEKERKLSNLRETIRKNLAKQQGAKNKDESDNDAVQSNDSYRKATDSQSNN